MKSTTLTINDLFLRVELTLLLCASTNQSSCIVYRKSLGGLDGYPHGIVKSLGMLNIGVATILKLFDLTKI